MNFFLYKNSQFQNNIRMNKCVNRIRPNTAQLYKPVFPSYSKIEKEVIASAKVPFNKKLNIIQQKISKIKKSVNIGNRHDQIKNRLLDMYNKESFINYNFQKNDQNQQLKWDAQTSNYLIPKQLEVVNNSKISSILCENKKQNEESLNCFIEEDIEQENHYQIYLKFRKKILQRQLEDDQECQKFSTMLTSKQKKIFGKNRLGKMQRKTTQQILVDFVKFKQRQQAEKLFKNLYNKQQKNMKSQTLTKSTLNTSKSKFDKKAINQLKPQKVTDSYDQYMINKNVLTSTFSKYLKDLKQTNIVKWRILQRQQKYTPELKTQGFYTM